MATNNEQLQDFQIAAALAESIYRRNSQNFQVTLRDLKAKAIIVPDPNANWATSPLRSQQIQNLVEQDDYYYNVNTGFVGQIVEQGSTYYVVFRGTDSAQSAFAAAAALF
jgi:hypothetical protein